MTWLRREAALVALAATGALAGCGAASAPAPPSGAAAGPPTVTATPTPDPLRRPAALPGGGSGTALPSAAPSPLATDQRLVSIPWQYVATRDGGRAIQIRSEVSGCTRFDHASVGESAAAVEVTVWARQPTAQRVVCPQLAMLVVGTVRLQEPLGHRQLLHAPSTAA